MRNRGKSHCWPLAGVRARRGPNREPNSLQERASRCDVSANGPLEGHKFERTRGADAVRARPAPGPGKTCFIEATASIFHKIPPLRARAAARPHQRPDLPARPT